jgi:hypothetical protein
MSDLTAFRRGAIEAAFILLGILGAFGIDAWWGERGASRLERELLTRLAVEAGRNRTELDRTLGSIEVWGARSDRFLSASPDDLLAVEPDSVELFVVSLMRAATFDPLDAAVTLFLQTPMTGEEGTTRIRALASEWNTELADAVEDRARLLEASRATERIVASYLVDEPRNDLLQRIRPEPELLAALRGDPDFIGALLVRLDNQIQYRRELNQALTVLDAIRVALAEFDEKR